MMSLTALVCPFMVLAIIIAIVVLIIRSFGRGGSSVSQPPPPANVVTQVAQDGFWLSSFEPGSVVYYRFWAADLKREGQITFQPGNDGRQFVYTGVQPGNVEIVRVIGPSGSVMTGPVYVDDTPDIMPPIIGGIAAQAIGDALANAQREPPSSPPPPDFPTAY